MRVAHSLALAVLCTAACFSDSPGLPSTSADSTSSGGTETGGSSTTGVGTSAGPSSTTAGESSGTGTTGPVGACGPEVILGDDPILYWRLGETSGTTAIDSSPNGQHATYVGVTPGVPGISADGDTAVHFGQAVDQHVILNPVAQFPTDAITVELWIRTSVNSCGGMLSYASTQSDNDFYLDDPAEVDLQVANVLASDISNVGDGQWHHVAATWRSTDGQWVVIVDGVMVGSGTGLAMGQTIAPGGAIVLGQDQDTIGAGFELAQSLEGDLDEVVVFDRALDIQAIETHRQAILCPN